MTFARHLLRAARPKRTYYAAVGHSTSPYVTVYPWSDITGFGAKYANPGTALPGVVNDISFHPSGRAIALAHNASPFFSVYAFSASGFGSKYADPAALPGTLNGIAFSPDGQWLLMTDANGAHIYPFSLTTGIGAKIASSPTISSGGLKCSWHPAGTYFVLGRGLSPYSRVYPFTSGTVGSAIDPGSAASGSGMAARFAPSGLAIAVADVHATNTITGYPFTSTYGTKFGNPSGMPTSAAYNLAFNYNGAFVAVASVNSPYVHVFPWDDATGYGTKLTSPAAPDLPPGQGNGVAFSPTDGALLVACIGSPYVVAYNWNSAFGARYSNPGTLPAGNAQVVAFGRI